MDVPTQDQWFWIYKAWPKADSAHVFLGAAVFEAGAAMFGEGWTGNEPSLVPSFNYGAVAAFSKPLPPSPPQLPSPNIPPRSIAGVSGGIDWEKLAAVVTPPPEPNDHVTRWRMENTRIAALAAACATAESVARAMRVVEWLAELGRNGELTTKGRLISGGVLFDVPLGFWNVEPVWAKRFAACQFLHWLSDQSYPAYTFVTRHSLNKALATLPFTSQAAFVSPGETSGLWLSPYMKIMIQTIRDLGIADDNMPTKYEVKHKMRELAPRFGLDFGEEPRGNEKDNANLERLATFVRSIESQKGRAR